MLNGETRVSSRVRLAAVEPSSRLVWAPIIDRAAEIVRSYETGVTLRQLFYRLVAAVLLPNTVGAYKRLSTLTAEARRQGNFPDLIDRTRSIHRFRSFDSPGSAKAWLAGIYQRDRTENQDKSIYLGVEKAGIIEQLEEWFGAPYGFPIIALGGYSSQTYVGEIIEDVESQDRPALLIYAGDFDASGEDIQRDLASRCGAFEEIRRIALTPEQIEEYQLPEQMGKASDPRAAGFVQRHGRLVQVELDALPPDVLFQLYSNAIADYWDKSTWEACIERETKERGEL